jgi:hypothetical protein
MPSRHPVNQLMVDNATRGERVADAVSGFMGSWRFIILQTLIVAAWVAGNVYLLFHFDPYPFIFLNLAFSTQAAYAAPLILLAGNRGAARDRLTLEHAAAQADVEERQKPSRAGSSSSRPASSRCSKDVRGRRRATTSLPSTDSSTSSRRPSTPGRHLVQTPGAPSLPHRAHGHRRGRFAGPARRRHATHRQRRRRGRPGTG